MAKVIERRGPWRRFEGVRYATLESVDRFKTVRSVSRTNGVRLFEPIGNVLPAEAEANACAEMETQAVAA